MKAWEEAKKVNVPHPPFPTAKPSMFYPKVLSGHRLWLWPFLKKSQVLTRKFMQLIPNLPLPAQAIISLLKKLEQRYLLQSWSPGKGDSTQHAPNNPFYFGRWI